MIYSHLSNINENHGRNKIRPDNHRLAGFDIFIGFLAKSKNIEYCQAYPLSYLNFWCYLCYAIYETNLIYSFKPVYQVIYFLLRLFNFIYFNYKFAHLLFRIFINYICRFLSKYIFSLLLTRQQLSDPLSLPPLSSLSRGSGGGWETRGAGLTAFEELFSAGWSF